MSTDPGTMLCPLCGRTLVAENDRDKHGRYHCPMCFESSSEAKRGWLPVGRVLTPQPATDSGFSRLLEHDPMFAANAKGEPITRDRSCECGRRFTQRLLSERFLGIVERQSRHAIDTLTKQIPGFYVPVHCPSCERRDLGHAARMAEARHEAKRADQPSFGEAAD